MIKAILFDMDGTLIDSERLNLEFMIQTCKEFGFDVDPADILSLRSNDPETCNRVYRNKYGDSFDFYEIRERRRELMRNHIAENGLPVKPGVYELMAHLKSIDVKTAVVTSTQYDRAMNYMKMIGLDTELDSVISAHMVKNGKPAPDVYLYASKIIGESPCDCLAVEDSPNGVRSAHAAGCKVAVVPDLTPPDDMMRRKSTWIVDNLADLIPIIDSEISR